MKGEVMQFLMYIIGFLGMFLLLAMLRLFFICWGWELFMMPVFGLADITMWQAVGLCLLLPSGSSSYNSKGNK